ncbi:MAG: hypothetical protein GY832_26185 [Chloroflexi bacterium]|nr:hypothetical protein [Chloroflexota bacterium]
MELTNREVDLILYLDACPDSHLSNLCKVTDQCPFDISADILRLLSLGFIKIKRDGARLVFLLPESTDPIETKRCPKCKQDKRLDYFGTDRSRKDNKKIHCKACQAKYARSPAGRAARQRWLDGGGAEKLRRYQQSEKGKADHYKAVVAHRKRNPQKAKAITAVARAVVRGKIPKATELNCLHCDEAAQEYHHPDYSKPLGVIPLCRQCHRDLHLQMKNKSGAVYA